MREETAQVEVPAESRLVATLVSLPLPPAPVLRRRLRRRCRLKRRSSGRRRNCSRACPPGASETCRRWWSSTAGGRSCRRPDGSHRRMGGTAGGLHQGQPTRLQLQPLNTETSASRRWCWWAACAAPVPTVWLLGCRRLTVSGSRWPISKTGTVVSAAWPGTDDGVDANRPGSSGKAPPGWSTRALKAYSAHLPVKGRGTGHRRIWDGHLAAALRRRHPGVRGRAVTRRLLDGVPSAERRPGGKELRVSERVVSGRRVLGRDGDAEVAFSRWSIRAGDTDRLARCCCPAGVHRLLARSGNNRVLRHVAVSGSPPDRLPSGRCLNCRPHQPHRADRASTTSCRWPRRKGLAGPCTPIDRSQ